MSNSSNLKTFDIGSISGLFSGIPEDYVLLQNSPNPFNPTRKLQYELPESSDIKFTIFDIMGRKVKEWTLLGQQAGWHKLTGVGRDMNGNSVSSGIYIYTLSADNYIETKKMIFMK